MTEYRWKKSNYKLMKGKWKIGILLEAGYQIVSVKDNLEKYIKLTDHIYFQSMLLPYLIIGRNPKNLFATKENLFELVSNKIGEATEFQIQPYL